MSTLDMYTPIKIKGLKQGDRVVFVNDHRIKARAYNLGPSNPLVGTKYETVGTVISIGGSCEVRWDNGEKNGYIDGDLALFNLPKMMIPI